MFENHREKILVSLDVSHTAFYRTEVFTGPSLYFHCQALEAARQGDFRRFVHDVYAVLASWGMHRMGRGGSKMCDFDCFESSLKAIWPLVLDLQKATPDLDHDGWEILRKIFCGIRCMASAASLVGNSKVMAHALPNLVPPVDREYTLMFLFGRKDIVNGVDREWETLRIILSDFYYPLSRQKTVRSRASQWMHDREYFRLDTSLLKVLDNLVIGHVRHSREAAPEEVVERSSAKITIPLTMNVTPTKHDPIQR